MTEIQKQLFDLQDLKYKDFHSKLIPDINPDLIIGVRTTDLRKFAKSFDKKKADEFIHTIPHKFYEENNLHAFLIERIEYYDECITALNDFLPFVDNWATCDMMRPKILKKHITELLNEIKKWINSSDTYTVRFGLEMLMCYYLDEHFDAEYLDIAASVSSSEYYVNMMIAWFFATALSKQYDAAIKYIESRELDTWVHNKVIQKANESLRITAEQKIYLKTLKLNSHNNLT